MKRLLLLILIVVVFAGVSICEDFTTFKVEMQKLLPATGNMGGWALKGRIEYYRGESESEGAYTYGEPSGDEQSANPGQIPSLWEYINGGAEIYYRYNFELLQVARFQRKGLNEAEITIEIYKMKTPLFAYGIYSNELGGSVDFVETGRQGYYVKDSLFFWKGMYYVKIMSYGFNDSEGKTLKQVGQLISDLIEDDTPVPEEAALFPKTAKVSFVPTNLLGLDFLGSGFMADHVIDGQNCKLLIKRTANTEEAVSILKKVKRFLLRTGAKESSLPSGLAAVSVLGFPSSRLGGVILLVKENYLVGLVDFKNFGKALSFAKKFVKTVEK